ncbi:MAG: B12-binding domain-containing radical SAM protein [Desulfobaccales bacterium]
MAVDLLNKHDKPVDALFVNPPSPDRFIYIRDINRHGRSSWERMIWPQTNLAYLAAVAAEHGLTVDIVDCIAGNIKWPRYREILRTCRPRYCFSNCISATFSNDIQALAAAKEISGAVTVAMGPHITARPEVSLQEAGGVDFIILQEAEETLGELIAVLEKQPRPGLERLEQVAGIGFVPSRVLGQGGEEPLITPARPFVKDMDSLPWPKHELLPLDKYWAPWLGHYTFVEASRGCPYRCIFCRQAVMWEWKYRRRSGVALAKEALYVHSLGVDNILFHADTFTADENLVHELCDALIAAGSPFRWACNSHVKNLYQKPGLVRKMKQAGCWMIAIGIESGDDEVLRTIKKQITSRMAEDVVRMVDAAGVEPWGYFVLGFPGDTPRTMAKTIDFALSLPLKMVKFDIATPYPGTEFFRYAQEKGYLRLGRYEDFDQNASAVVEYPDLSRQEIKRTVLRANLRFYLRPRMLPRILREALRPATAKTLLLIARDLLLLFAQKPRQKGAGA